jgi:hypothetical protein
LWTIAELPASGYCTSLSPSERRAAVVTAVEVNITAGMATHPPDTAEPSPRERANKTAEKTFTYFPDRGRTELFCVFLSRFIFVLPLVMGFIL